MTRRGVVFLDREAVGAIEETTGGMTFRYDAAWLARADARAISLTLPLRSEPYASSGLLPFFAGLLPEGWLFDISISTLKLAPDDGFGLLLALCRDCIGAVRIEPESSSG